MGTKEQFFKAIQQNKRIPALTLHQPYASTLGIVREFEPRTYNINYRGLIGIHAGSRRVSEHQVLEFNKEFDKYIQTKKDKLLIEPTKELLYTYFIKNTEHQLTCPHGVLLGFAILEKIIPIEKSFIEKLPSRERLFCTHTVGKFAYQFKEFVPIIPLSCKGHQNIWYLQKETLEKVRFLG